MRVLKLVLLTFALMLGSLPSAITDSSPSPILFELQKIPFHLENGVTPAKNAPETMAGGVAIFDYNGDGRPDIFFTNGANLATLQKDSPKFRNRLFRNDGNGTFTDVTNTAGLAGAGYGYASSSNGPVHFGLGADSHVGAIEIHWPPGAIQILRDVDADRVLKVTEPEK